jgi:cysteine desulfurase
MSAAIYLDHFATTPLDQRVLDAMLPYFRDDFGNPSSIAHHVGQRANQTVEKARDVIRRAVGCQSERGILFTSGATESNNLLIRGLSDSLGIRQRHIVVSSIEHKSVLEPINWLSNHGYRVTYVPVNGSGLIDPLVVADAIAPDTLLVSMMAVNNEVGAIQPLQQIGAMVRARGVLFHCDATQGVGKVPIDMTRYAIDFLSMSAHKIYGPKGIGALCVAHAEPERYLTAQLLGGGQEHGLRSGTLNVPGIVGLAQAIEVTNLEAESESERIRKLRDRLKGGLEANIAGVHVNGDPDQSIPGALNVSIAGVRSTAILARIQHIAVSGAAACGGQSAKSHVLTAMGFDRERVRSALRFCIGRFNTVEEIDSAVHQIATEVAWIRNQPVFGEAHSS